MNLGEKIGCVILGLGAASAFGGEMYASYQQFKGIIPNYEDIKICSSLCGGGLAAMLFSPGFIMMYNCLKSDKKEKIE